MSVFDQRYQTVISQTNNAVHSQVTEVSSQEDLLTVLEELTRSAKRAYGEEQITEAEWSEVKSNLNLATTEAELPSPDKSNLISFLNRSKEAVKGVVAVAELYEGMAKLAETLPHLPFLH